VRQALAPVVHDAEDVLRLGVALLGGEAESGCGFSEVAGVVVGDGLPVVRVGGCVRGIAAPAGDDARARGMEAERAADGDVLESAFGSIFHWLVGRWNGDRRTGSDTSHRNLPAEARGEFREDVAVFAGGSLGVEVELGDLTGEQRVPLGIEGRDVAFGVVDLADDSKKFGGRAFSGYRGVDLAMIVLRGTLLQGSRSLRQPIGRYPKRLGRSHGVALPWRHRSHPVRARQNERPHQPRPRLGPDRHQPGEQHQPESPEPPVHRLRSRLQRQISLAAQDQITGALGRAILAIA
jgi:hypothetical protein